MRGAGLRAVLGGVVGAAAERGDGRGVFGKMLDQPQHPPRRQAAPIAPEVGEVGAVVAPQIGDEAGGAGLVG
ncbi:hypothetical protein [Actinophytocola sp.]|uniref:hypothetical protein n=1 Tax=Actinophytocola sp. TaxID=1872138 RepID=UPI003D6C0E7B